MDSHSPPISSKDYMCIVNTFLLHLCLEYRTMFISTVKGFSIQHHIPTLGGEYTVVVTQEYSIYWGEPHTSGTALHRCVCMYMTDRACGHIP